MKRVLLFKWQILLLLSFIILFLGDCLKKKTIKVAFVGSLTGRYSEIGLGARNSIKMAVDEWNQRGGIGGRQIELTIGDDTGDPDSAIKLDSRLIKEGNKFIIGHMTSNMTPAILDKKNEDILFISPTMSTSELSIEGDNFIRTIPPSSYQSKLLSETFYKSGYKKCFAIFDKQNATYTKDVLSNFIKYMKAYDSTFTCTIDSIFKPTAKTFSEKAQKILDSNDKIVLIITNGIDFANLAQQLRRLEYDGFLYGPRWASTRDVIIHGGKSVEGAFFTAGHQSINIDTVNTDPFYDRYKTLYGRKPVNFIPVFAYDAANILFNGMSKSKEITPVSVRNSILKIKNFDGVDEVVSFDSYGDASRSISLITIKDGIFVDAQR